MADFAPPALTEDELRRVREYLGEFMQHIEAKTNEVVQDQFEKITAGPVDLNNLKKAKNAFDRSLTPYRRRPFADLREALKVFGDVFGAEAAEAVWLMFKASYLSSGPIGLAVADYIKTGNFEKPLPRAASDKSVYDMLIAELPAIEKISSTGNGMDRVAAGLVILLDMYKPEAETPEATSIEEILRREHDNLEESLAANQQALAERRLFTERAKKALEEAAAAKAAGKPYKPPTWADITAKGPEAFL